MTGRSPFVKLDQTNWSHILVCSQCNWRAGPYVEQRQARESADKHLIEFHGSDAVRSRRAREKKLPRNPPPPSPSLERLDPELDEEEEGAES